jgi:hypothetical protein
MTTRLDTELNIGAYSRCHVASSVMEAHSGINGELRETESLWYQYPFSTQPHRVATCRSMSSRIRTSAFELAKKEPSLQSALGPPFCIPKTTNCGRQIAVAASDLAAARRFAESIQHAAATVSRWQTFCATQQLRGTSVSF